MNAQTLWVPFSVLNDPSHTVATRLIWLLLGLRPAGHSEPLTDTLLHKLSGLDRKTIALARTRLVQAPLASCHSRPDSACAAVPTALLTDVQISARARLLYGQLQGVSNFKRQSGSFTYGNLSDLTGSHDDALRRAVTELVRTGWLTITQANRKRPISFTLRNPVGIQLRARISSIRRRVRDAQPRGEALLREFMNVICACDDYKDNALPDFLLNPYTGELMELDRYYPAAAVAFEFQGAQHFEVTDIATYEQTVKQVGRDAMKAFICKARGIELVSIHPEDLSVNVLDKKIPGRLPRRDLEPVRPLVAELEKLASEYRGRSAEERGRTGRAVRGAGSGRGQ